VSEGLALDDHERVAEIMTAAGQPITADEVAGIVDPLACVRAQKSLGSTNPAEVARMIEVLQIGLAEDGEETAEARGALRQAREETARRVAEALQPTG